MASPGSTQKGTIENGDREYGGELKAGARRTRCTRDEGSIASVEPSRFPHEGGAGKVAAGGQEWIRRRGGDECRRPEASDFTIKAFERQRSVVIQEISTQYNLGKAFRRIYQALRSPGRRRASSGLSSIELRGEEHSRAGQNRG